MSITWTVELADAISKAKTVDLSVKGRFTGIEVVEFGGLMSDTGRFVPSYEARLKFEPRDGIGVIEFTNDQIWRPSRV